MSFEDFSVTGINQDGVIQGNMMDGVPREFALVVRHDPERDEFYLAAARHYVDPASLAGFSGSVPWGNSEEDA